MHMKMCMSCFAANERMRMCVGMNNVKGMDRESHTHDGTMDELIDAAASLPAAASFAAVALPAAASIAAAASLLAVASIAAV